MEPLNRGGTRRTMRGAHGIHTRGTSRRCGAWRGGERVAVRGGPTGSPPGMDDEDARSVRDELSPEERVTLSMVTVKLPSTSSMPGGDGGWRQQSQILVIELSEVRARLSVGGLRAPAARAMRVTVWLLWGPAGPRGARPPNHDAVWRAGAVPEGHA